MEKEKVAVTGATGYIGRHLVPALIEKGYTISNDPDVTRVYHLACPSNTERINNDTLFVVDTILDLTRDVIKKWPNALIVNASSVGAAIEEPGPQGAYNVAKRCMELYLEFSGVKYINYRIPSVYGEDMHPDKFVKRCVDGTAYPPSNPDRMYWLAHIDEVIESLVELRPIEVEHITLGNIYELFNSGRRGLHRPATNQSPV